MISRKREFGSIDAEEAAELHRDLFSVVAHDLGGIASALSLRADALAPELAPADTETLRTLAAQVRDANRAMRLLKGPDGASMLAPDRSVTLEEWWHLTHRLTLAVLPRGMRIDTRLQSVRVSLQDASVLAHIWLASCKDLVQRGVHASSVLTFAASPVHEPVEGTLIEVDVAAQDWPPVDDSRRAVRWHRYASRLARLQEASLAWWHARSPDGGVLSWSCGLRRGRAAAVTPFADGKHAVR